MPIIVRRPCGNGKVTGFRMKSPNSGYLKHKNDIPILEGSTYF